MVSRQCVIFDTMGVSGGAAAVGIYAADVSAVPTDTPLLADITQRLPAAKCGLFTRRYINLLTYLLT